MTNADAGALVELTPGIWTVSTPLRFMGIEVGTRMTVVRLQSGGLLLHSPVALDDALREAVTKLGDVEHIVAPNLYHHLHAGKWVAAFPDAEFHMAVGLGKKRPDLTGRDLDGSSRPFGDELTPVAVAGTMLGEVVLMHHASQTMVSSDVVENFGDVDRWVTRVYLKLGGIWQKPGVSRFIKPMIRDKRAARQGIDELLEMKPMRMTLAHGEPIASDATEVLRESYTFLK